MSKKEKEYFVLPVKLPPGCLPSAVAGGLLISVFDSCLPWISLALASSCNHFSDKNPELLSSSSPLINFPFCLWQEPTLPCDKLSSTPPVPRACSASPISQVCPGLPNLAPFTSLPAQPPPWHLTLCSLTSASVCSPTPNSCFLLCPQFSE